MEILNKLGLSDKEIKLYKVLLENGRSTPTQLSKLTNINRATVYHTAKELIARGLVAEDLAGSVLHLLPLPPKNLLKTIDSSRRELDEKEKMVKEAITELSSLGLGGKYVVPKITFIEEKNLEKYLYDNASRWNKELMKFDGTWWGFQDHSLVENFEDWILWVGKTKEYNDPKINAKLLSNNSSIEAKIEKKIPKSKRNTRFAKDMNFTSTVWIVGEYIITVSTRQHPFYLIEIHDAMLAHNLRETFKKLWSVIS